MSEGTLRKLFRGDATLWVNRDLRLFYVEPPLPDLGDAGSASAPLAESAPFPLADTFVLHSNTGALRTIYLDFTGHVVSGTQWNDSATGDPFTATAFSIDDDPDHVLRLPSERSSRASGSG